MVLVLGMAATLEFLAITNLLLSAKKCRKKAITVAITICVRRQESSSSSSLPEIPFPKNSFLRGEKHVFIGACD